MKTQKSLKLNFIFIIVLSLFFCQHGFGQSKGVIKGVIFEASSGSTLPGATVVIAGTNNGVISNVNGEYTLTNVPTGLNQIVFSFVSFKSDTISVNLKAGETQIIDVRLKSEDVSLNEVTITSQLLGQKKAISQQINSDAIVNVVSEDKIKELPDVNAAEAISRLPGIAINRSGGEGQKIVIRGMEPKYAAITVNGVRVPSNSAGDRSVDLSLISPELLSGIEVFKTPLPNMDAESSAGTVNLKLRKAPDKLKVMLKGLSGYNNLENDFGDYKAVAQISNRFINKKVGLLLQSTVERFNRTGENIGYSWGQGGTNEETGITQIIGRQLTFNDNQEIRKRINSSVNIDYDLNDNHGFTIFGLLSQTNRDRFISTTIYDPSEPEIRFSGNKIDNSINLRTMSLSGNHTLGRLKADWSISTSQSKGETPYDFNMHFNAVSIGGLFSAELEREGHPETFLDAANLNANETYLYENELVRSNNKERTDMGFIDFKLPIQLSDNIKASFEFGGRYSKINRSRDLKMLAEPFYYLGTSAVQSAKDSYGDGLEFIPSNANLISVNNFINPNGNIGIQLEDGSNFSFPIVLDKNKLQNWSSIQEENFRESRAALVDVYSVQEEVTAAYAMIKFKVGNTLTVIPGFRYEHSNNSSTGPISDIFGFFGQGGQVSDSTTNQTYSEFFPHLHLKYKPLEWFDIRASYAKTIARPDFNFIIPTALINRSTLDINAGNPSLKYALSTSYDVNLTFYKSTWGLFSIGGFYKNIDNIFIKRSAQLIDPEYAEALNWPGFSGYTLDSYTNIPTSKVWGYEMELQTNLSMLPQPFKGVVISLNYSKLYSETEVFFLTSETVFQGGFPPIPVTTYTENSRKVSMPTQAPEIFRASIGYDIKGFSARISGSYQGSKARSYSLNKDFDSYDLEFWRWDASAKQRIGKNWSVFLNVNNFTNQKDVRFIRNTNFIRNIESYGATGTIGVQYNY